MEFCPKEDIENLWKRYHETRSQDYRDRLIDHYLYLVKYSVGKIASALPSHLTHRDLYSYGVSGLIKAVEKFDLLRNKKFENYASFIIRASVIDELRKSDWVPRSVHQKATKLSKSMEILRDRLGREPSDKDLAEHLGISENELLSWFSSVRPIVIISLNETICRDNDSLGVNLVERLIDGKAEDGFKMAEKKEYFVILSHAIEALEYKEKQILRLYYYDDLILKEIANRLGISESRVSQIHSKALIKLKSSLKSLFET
ncbi:MAG: FliA/WhiG family RNA polymerase sigma factor [Victivallaceae bacterium]